MDHGPYEVRCEVLFFAVLYPQNALWSLIHGSYPEVRDDEQIAILTL